MQDCRQNHDGCNWDLESFLPTRLLDLQAFQMGEDVKLVCLRTEDFDDQPYQPEYLTLSHCWGPPEKRPVISTKANLQERMTRIKMEDLSNTFRDAVRITREIGERYLWIDSLCIIQDDKDDWAREAALMADVYGQSCCTLAALDSKDSTEGCKLVPDIQNIGTFFEFDSGAEYLRDDPFFPFSYRIRIFEDEPREWHEEYGDNPYRHGDYGNQPLRTRAWTLQERELSRRNIHFGRAQMLWECRELKASTQLPWHHKKPEDDFEPMPIIPTRERWYELMEDYSFRNLTYEMDKLPALSGLARSFQHSVPQTEYRTGMLHSIFVPQAKYLAGIWSTHLPEALLWRTRYTGRRSLSGSYIAPTWSWASVVGSITYESQRLEHGKRIEDHPKERPLDSETGNLSVESMSTQPKHDDEHGAILSASLSFTGALLASIDSNPQLHKFKDDYRGGSTAIMTKDGVPVGVLYPDVRGEMPYAKELFCLRLRPEPDKSQIRRPGELYEGEEAGDLIMGLVLAREPNIGNESCLSNQYKRIGLARWVKSSLFESCQPSVVTLL